jgi:hypothetical protein
MAQCGGGHERNGLQQVGADEVRRAQHRVEQEQGDDDEGAGADGRHAYDQTSDDPDENRW